MIMLDERGTSLEEANHLVRRLKIEAILFFIGIFPAFALLLALIMPLGSLGFAEVVIELVFFTGWVGLTLGSIANYYEAREKVKVAFQDDRITDIPTRKRRILNILAVWATFATLATIALLASMHG